MHRYKEIESFPEVLNNSQKWNWHTRMFLAEARQNLTAEAEAGVPSKWTDEELNGLEQTLKAHEAWLDEWVEKQRSVKSYEDPVIEMTEMKARAKQLETKLLKFVKRRVPKVKAKKKVEEDAQATEESKPASSPAAEQDRQHDEL